RTTTLAQRQRLLSYGGSPLAVLPSFLALLFAMFSLVTLVTLLSGGSLVNQFLFFIAGVIILVATLGVPLLPLTILPTRRSRMGQELLFPWTRREYINGLFKRSIVSAAIADTMCVLLLLLLWGYARQFDQGWNGPKASELLSAICVLVLFQINLFGCSLHIARATSGRVRVCLVIVSVLVLFASVLFFGALFDALGPVVGGAALVVAAVGGLLWIRKARDEWLLEELG